MPDFPWRSVCRKECESIPTRSPVSRSHGLTADSLARSDAFYQSLVETLPQNFFRKDLLGRLTYANSLYCQTIGLSFDRLVGKRDEQL